MKVILSGLLFLLKGMVWILFTALKLALEGVKIILLLFGLVMRIFLVFVRVGTP